MFVTSVGLGKPPICNLQRYVMTLPAPKGVTDPIATNA